MSGTITVTPEPGNVPPRYRIQVAGAAGATVTVTRTNADGSTYLVRSANPATLTSGSWAGYDYESPFNSAGTYSYVTSTGETGSASAVALREWGVQDPWLIHPGIPDLSVQLAGVTVGARTRDTMQGTHVVMGRRSPVIVTDGARHSPVLQLTCKTFDDAGEQAMDALLDDASVLLLQDVQPFTARSFYYWVSVGQSTVTDLTDDFGEWYLQWTLPLTVTSAPSGMLQSQWAYADLLAHYATYSALDAAYATYNDVVINNHV